MRKKEKAAQKQEESEIAMVRREQEENIKKVSPEDMLKELEVILDKVFNAKFVMKAVSLISEMNIRNHPLLKANTVDLARESIDDRVEIITHLSDVAESMMNEVENNIHNLILATDQDD